MSVKIATRMFNTKNNLFDKLHFTVLYAGNLAIMRYYETLQILTVITHNNCKSGNIPS